MAMTKTTMWASIKNYIAAVSPSQGSDPAAASAYRDAVGEAMCQGIIDEITQNGVVSVPSVSAVQPGTGISGPGTGTIS